MENKRIEDREEIKEEEIKMRIMKNEEIMVDIKKNKSEDKSVRLIGN